MDDDPFSRLGLRPVAPADRPLFDAAFASLASPLSDYTFSQLFTWSNSLRILHKQIKGHLCVFANGTGDLTLLMPPIGEGNSDAALAEAFEVMDAYNHEHGVPDRSRVEYASDELLARLDRSKLNLTPMGGDYLYDTARMIDLAGGALASKRQLKTRFTRLYDHRVEVYDPAKHFDDCKRLLTLWKNTQDAHHNTEASTSALKRRKESTACLLTLQHAHALGLKGLVVYATPRGAPDSGLFHADPHAAPALSGFTFGEELGADQASIVIEKTDLAVRGLAQFIFSEFCRASWSHRLFTNAGDDWGLETLAWTKQSYRPVKMLQKHAFTLTRPVLVAVPAEVGSASADRLFGPADGHHPQSEISNLKSGIAIRPALRSDLPAALALEQSCFTAHQLSRRQLHYLHKRSTAIFLVAEEPSSGQLIGDCIALVRESGRGVRSGRIYSVAVHRDHRRRKLGRRLISTMIDALAARGVKRVYLEVQQANAPAIALYKALGFTPIGNLPDYYAPGEHALHMMLELPAARPTEHPSPN